MSFPIFILFAVATWIAGLALVVFGVTTLGITSPWSFLIGMLYGFIVTPILTSLRPLLVR